MLKNPSSLVIALFIAYILLNKSADKVLDGFSVRDVKVKAPSFTIEEARFEIELEILNENIAGGTVTSFNGSLLLGGTVLAALSFNQEVEILGNSITKVPILARIIFDDLDPRDLGDLIGGGWKKGVKVVGTLTLKNGLAIPVDKSIITIG